jgi:hypothetical protein
MSERFRFDPRVDIPPVPAGKEVVKCFGLPLVVSAPLPGESVFGSGLTESQAREVAQFIRTQGVGRLSEQKRLVAEGRLR